MYFEWDEEKNQVNIKKHGLSFEQAIHVFADPNRITFWDEKHSYMEEEREITIGKISNYLVVFVVATDINGVTRIISARKAEKSEEELYYGKNREKNLR